jgi:hypothetical protein
MPYVSIGILHNLEFTYKQVLTFTDEDKLFDIMKGWWDILLVQSFYSDWASEYTLSDIKTYTERLLEEKCLCWVSIARYYVICIAIDFESINIWSENCWPMLIDWSAECKTNNVPLTEEMLKLADIKRKEEIDIMEKRHKKIYIITII